MSQKQKLQWKKVNDMDDLARLYNAREQLEIMMEQCPHSSTQDEIRKKLDDLNRQIATLEMEDENE